MNALEKNKEQTKYYTMIKKTLRKHKLCDTLFQTPSIKTSNCIHMYAYQDPKDGLNLIVRDQYNSITTICHVE